MSWRVGKGWGKSLSVHTCITIRGEDKTCADVRKESENTFLQWGGAKRKLGHFKAVKKIALIVKKERGDLFEEQTSLR